jgi:hypothetical protein
MKPTGPVTLSFKLKVKLKGGADVWCMCVRVCRYVLPDKRPRTPPMQVRPFLYL